MPTEDAHSCSYNKKLQRKGPQCTRSKYYLMTHYSRRMFNQPSPNVGLFQADGLARNRFPLKLLQRTFFWNLCRRLSWPRVTWDDRSFHLDTISQFSKDKNNIFSEHLSLDKNRHCYLFVGRDEIFQRCFNFWWRIVLLKMTQKLFVQEILI